MDDLKISWRNIWRNKRRSLLTIMAIVFASCLLIFMLSFQLGSYEDMIDTSVKLYTGHIQVMSKGHNDDRKIRKIVGNPDQLFTEISKIDSVKGVSVRAEGFCLASSEERTKGVFISGVNPEQEKIVSRLSNSIQNGKYFEKDDYDSAVAGYLLARRLKLKIGDEITILGQGRDGSVSAGVVRLKGVFKSGRDEFDKSVIHVPFSYFNDVFYMESKAHSIVVLLDSIKQIKTAQEKIRELIDPDKNEVLNWEELLPGLKQSINLDLISGSIMYLVLIIVVSFSILNTFLMSILERKKEYGVLLAIGTAPGRLVKFVMTESMLMTITGLAVGMVLGSAITIYFAKNGIGLGEAVKILSEYGISDRIYPKLSFSSLISGPVFIFVTTLITAYIPALQIRKLKPVEAINSI